MQHKSVLVDEVLTYLNIKPNGVYVDVTFGSGGHTQAILEREPSCTVVAIDWDMDSLETYGTRLKENFGDRLILLWGNFALLYKLLKKTKIQKVDGILADFGTSQMQLFEHEGFSVYRDSPLDMRMSPAHQKITAADVVAHASERELSYIFFHLGEERFANRIARSIVEYRKKKPIRTTKQLADLVVRAIPEKRHLHPATKVFQALRMYINKELENIKALLAVSVDILKKNGSLVCISFHSLEDRLVKHFLQEQQQKGTFEIITPHVVVPTEQEIQKNPSARSARLRAARRL